MQCKIPVFHMRIIFLIRISSEANFASWFSLSPNAISGRVDFFRKDTGEQKGQQPPETDLDGGQSLSQELDILLKDSLRQIIATDVKCI